MTGGALEGGSGSAVPETNLPACPCLSLHSPHPRHRHLCVQRTLLSLVVSHRKSYYRWRHPIKVQAALRAKAKADITYSAVVDIEAQIFFASADIVASFCCGRMLCWHNQMLWQPSGTQDKSSLWCCAWKVNLILAKVFLMLLFPPLCNRVWSTSFVSLGS